MDTHFLIRLLFIFVLKKTEALLSFFRLPSAAKSFLFYAVPRQTLGPAQPPFQWAPKSSYPLLKVRDLNFTTHVHLQPV